MSIAPTNVKFIVNPNEPESLLYRFQEMIHGIPNFHFKQMDVRQSPDESSRFPITLYATNGFNFKVSGVRCGEGKRSQPLIDLLKFCEFDLNEETIYTILNCSTLCLTLYNEKYF